MSSRTRCGGCGVEFNGEESASLLSSHVKENMSNEARVNNHDWHYPSSLYANRDEQVEREEKIDNEGMFWRKLPAGKNEKEAQEDFVLFREAYQSSKRLFESGSIEEIREELSGR